MDISYTQDQVGEVARALLATLTPTDSIATVVGLSGDLGAGKTTLVQAIAKELGVEQTVVSPTFVIAKWYTTQHNVWKALIHIDAYRIENVVELEKIGWNDICAAQDTLVIVEWPEHITSALPAHTVQFLITHASDTRHITTI